MRRRDNVDNDAWERRIWAESEPLPEAYVEGYAKAIGKHIVELSSEERQAVLDAVVLSNRLRLRMVMGVDRLPSTVLKDRGQ